MKRILSSVQERESWQDFCPVSRKNILFTRVPLQNGKFVKVQNHETRKISLVPIEAWNLRSWSVEVC